MNLNFWLDRFAEYDALRLRDREDATRCGGQSQTFTETLFASAGAFTAVASTASEASLIAMASNPVQPFLSAAYPLNHGNPITLPTVVLEAQGVLSNTGTPTIIFQVRTSTTQGSSTLSGSSLGVSAAITTQSGVTNKYWYLRLMMIFNLAGMGTGNCTVTSGGYVFSPTGFASPFLYPLEVTTPDTATWTQTLDASLTQYLNLSCTWSASSSSNTITLKQLFVHGLN